MKTNDIDLAKTWRIKYTIFSPTLIFDCQESYLYYLTTIRSVALYLLKMREERRHPMRHIAAMTHAEKVIEQAWSLIGDARVREARGMSEKLVQEILDLLEGDDESNTELLRRLVPACHVAGYTVGMSVRDSETLVAVSYFDEMLRAARKLKDDSFSVIALTYQGNLYRRYGNLKEAMHCLQIAYATQQADQAAHGNCAQLLGRLYSQMDDGENFARMMKEAEQIAHSIDLSHTSLHGQYCLGTVYIDYSKHYCKLGETHKAFDYFAKAEKSLPDMLHWNTLLTATHGLLLVRSGNIEQGMPYVVKAVKLALDHGNYRLLDHFYALQNYLGQKSVEFNQANVRLGESLYGVFAN
jgi:tetratricopeptide (TPR) repeat protein